jgi:transcriptional regulator with XRE-family HTH domain
MQQHRSPRTTHRTAEEVFGVALRECRKQRALSQEGLAFESGYHPSYIGHLERGKKSPSLRTIFGLASTLCVAPSELIRRVEERLGKGWKPAVREGRKT